jgi:hypothetical protein
MDGIHVWQEAAEQYTIALLRLKAVAIPWKINVSYVDQAHQTLRSLSTLCTLRFVAIASLRIFSVKSGFNKVSRSVTAFKMSFFGLNSPTPQEVAAEVQAESQTLKALLLANRAQAHLKLQHWEPQLQLQCSCLTAALLHCCFSQVMQE